tara:strand:- start:31 stop:711 length:681 start_codon:yes stop_codon:yes gene_type:complete
MPIPLAAAIIGGGASIIGGIFGAASASKRAEKAAKEKRKLTKKLSDLEDNRQEIINPYEGIQDLSSIISNPFANLSVATGAAEMQIEEADISLANTLDTLRSTGAGAGGATALAQAALQSKKGVSASIEAQEKANEDKRAAGEQTLQQQKMAEAQRLQQADVAGEQFMFSTREGREMQQLDRTASMLGAAKQAEAQADSDRTGAITGAIGSLTGMAGAYYGSQPTG